jgi:hypothetical protein
MRCLTEDRNERWYESPCLLTGNRDERRRFGRTGPRDRAADDVDRAHRSRARACLARHRCPAADAVLGTRFGRARCPPDGVSDPGSRNLGFWQGFLGQVGRGRLRRAPFAATDPLRLAGPRLGRARPADRVGTGELVGDGTARHRLAGPVDRRARTATATRIDRCVLDLDGHRAARDAVVPRCRRTSGNGHPGRDRGHRR